MLPQVAYAEEKVMPVVSDMDTLLVTPAAAGEKLAAGVGQGVVVL